MKPENQFSNKFTRKRSNSVKKSNRFKSFLAQHDLFHKHDQKDDEGASIAKLADMRMSNALTVRKLKK